MVFMVRPWRLPGKSAVAVTGDRIPRAFIQEVYQFIKTGGASVFSMSWKWLAR
jgi:hypothetical protein